jgi:hypothetical protein
LDFVVKTQADIVGASKPWPPHSWLFEGKNSNITDVAFKRWEMNYRTLQKY